MRYKYNPLLQVGFQEMPAATTPEGDYYKGWQSFTMKAIAIGATPSPGQNAYLIKIDREVTLTKVRTNAGGGLAGHKSQIGIYECKADGYPGDKITQLATPIDRFIGGVQEILLSPAVTLQPGWYYVNTSSTNAYGGAYCWSVTGLFDFSINPLLSSAQPYFTNWYSGTAYNDILPSPFPLSATAQANNEAIAAIFQ